MDVKTGGDGAQLQPDATYSSQCTRGILFFPSLMGLAAPSLFCFPRTNLLVAAAPPANDPSMVHLFIYFGRMLGG